MIPGLLPQVLIKVQSNILNGFNIKETLLIKGLF